jgi:hypothetical protein
MWLDCGEHGRVELSRITPKSVVARHPRPVPPGPAELVICVDGQCERHQVSVGSGFLKGRLVALVRPAGNVAPF